MITNILLMVIGIMTANGRDLIDQIKQSAEQIKSTARRQITPAEDEMARLENLIGRANDEIENWTRDIEDWQKYLNRAQLDFHADHEQLREIDKHRPT